MKALLTLLFLCLPFITNAQFFKYSTFYVSSNIESPLTEQPRYMMDRITQELTDITVVHPHDYRISLGIRKVARFDYEKRAKVFYDGTENSISTNATIGATTGHEYLLSYESIRERGQGFVNHEYWYRYIGKNFIIKGEYVDKQDIRLKTFGADIRGKIDISKFNITAGVKHRSHPVYGLNPFNENFDLNEDAWWNVAYDLGYVDEYYEVGTDYSNWNWYDPDGNLIAITDEEFMKYHFGRAVSVYNDNELKSLGLQQELSAVVGVSYYHYTPKIWVHVWGDVLPYHIGLTDYSYVDMDIADKNLLDFDFGGVVGTKITKRLGVFIEGRYQRYWDIKNYQVQAGINYSIF